MPRTRRSNLFSLLKGFLAAIGITLAGMLLIALAVTYLHLPDKSIRFFNQLVKISAIILGTCVAVRRGDEMGLASGTLIGLGYMALGYGMYMALGGGSFGFSSMLGEMLIGTAVGAVAGTVRANMSAKRRKG